MLYPDGTFSRPDSIHTIPAEVIIQAQALRLLLAELLEPRGIEHATREVGRLGTGYEIHVMRDTILVACFATSGGNEIAHDARWLLERAGMPTHDTPPSMIMRVAF